MGLKCVTENGLNVHLDNMDLIPLDMEDKPKGEYCTIKCSDLEVYKNILKRVLEYFFFFKFYVMWIISSWYWVWLDPVYV